MNSLTKVGKIVFAIPFFMFGAFHFMNAGGMEGVVPSYVPGGVFWVYLTGVAHLLAAIAILANKMVRIAGILLGVMLILMGLMVHLPAFIDGNQMEMANLMKNIALAGGAFIIAGLSD